VEERGVFETSETLSVPYNIPETLLRRNFLVAIRFLISLEWAGMFADHNGTL
jgi:hypothetical protein